MVSRGTYNKCGYKRIMGYNKGIQLIFTGISLKEKFVSGVCFYLYARAT